MDAIRPVGPPTIQPVQYLAEADRVTSPFRITLLPRPDIPLQTNFASLAAGPAYVVEISEEARVKQLVEAAASRLVRDRKRDGKDAEGEERQEPRKRRQAK